MDDDALVCGTPIRWVCNALGLQDCDGCEQLCTMSDMFPESGTRSPHQYDIFLMDVILNRSSEAVAYGEAVDLDRVIMMRAYKPEDQTAAMDFKFRTMIAFLPGTGSFYCARECRRSDTGVARSLVCHDMSWLRMKRDCTAHGDTLVSYTFGDGGFVRRFTHESTGGNFAENKISAWRVSPIQFCSREENRLMHRVQQCADKDGPMMAPDVIAGQDVGKWPQECLAYEYNKRLASSKSARSGGRHYATGCLHYAVLSTCWLLDPRELPRLDLMVDVSDRGECTNRQTVVSIRNTLDANDGTPAFPSEAHVVDDISNIVSTNGILRTELIGHGSVRSDKGDVGSMHALGMRIELDGRTVSQYRAGERVPEEVLRTFVSSLSSVGETCFPGVMPVIVDAEEDSGLDAMPVMEGLEQPLGNRRRVGYTIDMSINLGNASHYDVNDASQGFSVWTEDFSGVGYNWYFLMPNLYGRRPDGSGFSGVAVRLSQGVAISWDGRVLRHCTSLSHPDGPPHLENPSASPRVSSKTTHRFRNNLYGNFTGAKEKIVNAGRVQSAASCAHSCDADETSHNEIVRKRKHNY